MKLDVRERLTLLGIMPQEGNFITLKVLRKLKDNLSFSEEEIKKYNFKQVDQHVTWEQDTEPKAIEIGTQAKIIIQDALKKLDEEKKLTEAHLTLYEKFVDKGKNAKEE